jgi:hypothetical protein
MAFFIVTAVKTSNLICEKSLYLILVHKVHRLILYLGLNKCFIVPEICSKHVFPRVNLGLHDQNLWFINIIVNQSVYISQIAMF